MDIKRIEHLYSLYMLESRNLHEDDCLMGDSELSLAADVINWVASKHSNVSADVLTVADALIIGFQMGRRYEAKEQESNSQRWEEAASAKEEAANENFR